ncbi:MAG: hypothetical protein Q9168_003434 [Polycauliona sp. 1 TL-2023]
MMEHEGRRSSGHHHHPSQRGTPGGRRSKEHEVSLEEGIQELFDSANEAIGFFTRFEQDFNGDVQRISRYCSERITDAIWKAKAREAPRESHDGRAGRRRGGENERDSERQERRQPPPSLGNSLGQLLSGIEDTVRIAEEFRPSQRRPSRYKPEDVAGIRRHLARAYRALHELFPDFIEKSSKMKPVVTELEILVVSLKGHVAGNDADRGAGGGRRSGGGRDMGQRETGGQKSYGGEEDEPEEEWDGGQQQEQGDAGGGDW